MVRSMLQSQTFTLNVSRFLILILKINESLNDEIEDGLNTSFDEIKEALEKWTHNGSGWIVDRVVGMDITITKYQPFMGGSYIELHCKKVAENSLVKLLPSIVVQYFNQHMLKFASFIRIFFAQR